MLKPSASAFRKTPPYYLAPLRAIRPSRVSSQLARAARCLRFCETSFLRGLLPYLETTAKLLKLLEAISSFFQIPLEIVDNQADFASAVRLPSPRPSIRTTGGATKYYDRATNAHFRPDKPRGATGKSLIVLNPWLTLNQRVPGSSPGAPTIAKALFFN